MTNAEINPQERLDFIEDQSIATTDDVGKRLIEQGRRLRKRALIMRERKLNRPNFSRRKED